ncbi:MAG: Multiple RNA-binding domain-containing protein 1 [Pycnora praestabilis]|nr:MAG: Multiple RNA-binding domain-containing protein 1 [Pycnora praestabilis]
MLDIHLTTFYRQTLQDHMASSRVFIRGLPPNISEDEFRKHFSRQQIITDAKLIPHRRIGYVGYKTPEDALRAIKYFNRSFIRMSKIAVEIARPVSNALPNHSSQTTTSLALKFQEPIRATVGHLEDGKANHTPKRKREAQDNGQPDSKLQEYLNVMRPPSKSKSWADEGIVQKDDKETKNEEHMVVQTSESISDEEYEAVPKRSKNARKDGKSVSPSSKSMALQTLPEPPIASRTLAEGNNGITNGSGLPSYSANETIEHDATVSDTDWLRSRTSRLLGLGDGKENTPLTAADMNRTSVSPPKKRTSADPKPISREDGTTLAPQENVENIDEHMGDDLVKAISKSGRLFVRNLPYSTTESEIREQFSANGSPHEVHLPVDHGSGNSKGFAYVQYADHDLAVQAYLDLDRKIFQGRLLHIIPATDKRETKLDDFTLSKLPLKKQKQIKRKNEAASMTFNWNSLYMNADAVISSISDRLGIAKSDVLDVTSSDAAVKQAHAETHIIQETRSYFASNGVNLDALQTHNRVDTTILVKNFSYGTKIEEIKKLFEDFGPLKRVLMPPSGTIAIVELEQAPLARKAFASLAYRKFKDSVLFLEKGPKNLFTSETATRGPDLSSETELRQKAKPSTSDLLEEGSRSESVDTSTLFVRNLNFSTHTDRLTQVFQSLDGFMSARVKTKPEPKRPGQTLSMGFGFLEFRSKAQAQSALLAMDGYNLDGHQLLIKASHKGLDAAEERRREEKGKKLAGRRTKIIIKNLPFEAAKKDLRSLFGSYGQLRSIRVPKKFDSTTRGFAFADFVTAREAENAMDALKDTHLLGRRLVLEFAAEDTVDAEEEIAKMQKKVGQQVNKVAVQRLTGTSRRRFNVEGDDEVDQGL